MLGWKRAEEASFLHAAHVLAGSSSWAAECGHCTSVGVPALSLSRSIDSHTYKAASCRLRPITPVNWAAQSSKEKWKVIKGNGAFQVGSSCRKPPCFFPWKKSAVEAKEKFCLCCVYSHGQQEECAKPCSAAPGPPHICPMLHTFKSLTHVNYRPGHRGNVSPV